jgi:hypothetical protein
MTEPVNITDWRPHEDFAIFPVGSKPKRMIICPAGNELAGLIPSHSYLFKTPTGWQSQQIWSEIIAYELAKLLGLDVPPCHLGYDPATKQLGALVEFFYGYPGDPSPARFFHGSDFLRLTDKRAGRPHGIRLNVWLCKRLGLDHAEDWWARVLAFDALIGNTDRHPENWGFLIRLGRENPQFAFAPAFDNATSLGYEITQANLPKMTASTQLEAYIGRGTHHCSWDPAALHGDKHFELCGKYLDAYPDSASAMRGMVNFATQDIAAIVQRCSEYDVESPFTAERAKFVSTVIESRRIKLASLCGG